MTPNGPIQIRDPIQVRTAVKMFLEYLLEHREMLQAIAKENQGRDNDTPPEQKHEESMDNSAESLADFDADERCPDTSG